MGWLLPESSDRLPHKNHHYSCSTHLPARISSCFFPPGEWQPHPGPAVEAGKGKAQSSTAVKTGTREAVGIHLRITIVSSPAAYPERERTRRYAHIWLHC